MQSHASELNASSHALESNTKPVAPIGAKIVEKLLDLLSTDDEFRRLFKKDPEMALLRIGYEPPIDGTLTMKSPFRCLQVQKLASKAVISKSRESLLDYLTAGLSMSPIQLNARTSGVLLKRK